ncbi:hypothetical protein KTC96_23850 (plasmid) [Clostridium estertheticum]|uniref:hypothetical protein n=1 Tax=Clostridium estertheticum TaxID=238834 RepID=UPI001C7D76C9|nr:hypothetical protein [Clostridium estertheticum]MBX4262194.1 hypothetical protein [Clostridium estertheticum]WLC73165.1 hypothetical protein KTC96_23850 [Clostridium estertheticum]
MNLTISQLHSNNYTTKNFKNNKDEKFSLELDDKKISEEEDKKLYELYQKSHMAHSAKSFEDFKKDEITFPPNTAPGIVRKGWREKWEKATQEEKNAMMDFDIVYENFLEENKENMPNDLNGYENLMEKMKVYMERYNNCPGVSKETYEGLVNVANSFETELNKYN